MDPLSNEEIQHLTPNLDKAFESLSRSASAGNETAQREMIATCRDYLLFIANQEIAEAIRPKCAPSDIVQNTMVRAVEKYSNFRGDNKKTLLAWLRRILINELEDARRHFRADKRDVHRESPADNDDASATFRPELQDADLTPASDAQAREEAARLRTALLALSKDHQEVLRLRNWEKLKFAEIAEKMGRSEDAAKKLWGRAVEALKSQLGE